jgi:hypothetical protein
MRQFMLLLVFATCTFAAAQPNVGPSRKEPVFDLFLLNDGVRVNSDGPMCLSKGRFQDTEYNFDSKVMDKSLQQEPMPYQSSSTCSPIRDAHQDLTT